MDDIVDRAKTAVSERVELPGMTLMQHLEELRRRLIHSGLYLAGGFVIAWIFHQRIYGYVQAPITYALAQHHLPTQLIIHNPVDGFNMYMKISLMAGCILASPFILYQVWLFISPGLYKSEKRYILPFMGATVTLFLAGAYFGYRWVFPDSLDFLFGFSRQFRPLIEVNEYTNLFMTVILGLGAAFEMPVLVFFLSLFGIVSPKFLWKNLRFAILIIFIFAAIITPSPDPLTMGVFAAPLLSLYFLSIGVSYMVYPANRKKREAERAGKATK